MDEAVKHIGTLQARIDSIVSNEAAQFDQIESRTETSLMKNKSITEAKIGLIETRTISSLQKAYLKTSYDVAQIIVHHSPSLLGTLSAIYGVLKTIYQAVSWFINTFKIKEIIQIIDIVRSISPKFRAWTNQLLQGLKDFANDIGIGAATFYHVLHAMQGTLSATAGMLGKDWDWLESKYVEKSLSLAKRIEFWGDQVQENPAAFVEDVFVHEKVKETKEQNEQWQKIWDGIETGVEWGKEAINNTQTLFNEIQGLKNALPKYVKEYIPQQIWDTVDEAQTILNNTIEPRFRDIEKTLKIVDSAVNSHREKLNKLGERLSLPGDYLSEINALDEQLRALQESKVDDVSGNQFNNEATNQNNETTDIFNDMQVIDEAGIPPGAAPSFLGLEPRENTRPAGAPQSEYETWFVGDF